MGPRAARSHDPLRTWCVGCHAQTTRTSPHKPLNGTIVVALANSCNQAHPLVQAAGDPNRPRARSLCAGPHRPRARTAGQADWWPRPHSRRSERLRRAGLDTTMARVAPVAKRSRRAPIVQGGSVHEVEWPTEGPTCRDVRTSDESTWNGVCRRDVAHHYVPLVSSEIRISVAGIEDLPVHKSIRPGLRT